MAYRIEMKEDIQGDTTRQSQKTERKEEKLTRNFLSTYILKL
jgi:hypothetical protein